VTGATLVYIYMMHRIGAITRSGNYSHSTVYAGTATINFKIKY